MKQSKEIYFLKWGSSAIDGFIISLVLLSLSAITAVYFPFEGLFNGEQIQVYHELQIKLSITGIFVAVCFLILLLSCTCAVVKNPRDAYHAYRIDDPFVKAVVDISLVKVGKRYENENI